MKNTIEKSAVEIKINKILSNEFDIDVNKIKNESNIRVDLKIDSLMLMDLGLILDEEFDMHISDEEIYKWEKVQDIYNLIDDNLKSREKIESRGY